jgi:bifunctional NMN adenylyltransferase/nudix hydrolase
MRTYDAAVFIGRFQPLHNVHLQIIKRGLEVADKLIIIIGSAKKPRTFENPFPAVEREDMIRRSILDEYVQEIADLEPALQKSLLEQLSQRIVFEYNIDTFYSNDAWLIRVQEAVGRHTQAGDRIGLIGHKKEGDRSTFYLDMFKQWDTIDQAPLDFMDASTIRELYFQRSNNLEFLRNVVPTPVYRFLSEFNDTEEFQQIIKERQFIEKHNEMWKGTPYPVSFAAGDAVLTGAGHVLMITRRAEPGKGLLAFPGGYLDVVKDVTMEDTALRELEEETGIKLQREVLRSKIIESRVFDAVNRSPRGRIISHAFHIKLDDMRDLPKVKGGDDAARAQWIPIGDVKSEDCFEDHYEILNSFISGGAA